MLATIQPQHLVNSSQDKQLDDSVIRGWLVNHKKSTSKQYFSVLRQFYNFLSGLKQPSYSEFVEKNKPLVGVKLSKISFKNLMEFKEYLESQQYALATIKNKMNAIKSLLSHSTKIGFITFNAGAVVKTETPSDNLLERFLTVTEVESLLATIDNLRDKTLFMLTYYCGLRISEALNLRWENIKSNRVKVYGKGNKTRVLTIHPTALSQLNKLREFSKSEYIFTGEGNRNNGGKMSAVTAHRFAKLYGKKAGISNNFSCHWLRHSIATHLLQAGYSIVEIKEFLGHASIVTTNGYAKAILANDLTDKMPILS